MYLEKNSNVNIQNQETANTRKYIINMNFFSGFHFDNNDIEKKIQQ